MKIYNASTDPGTKIYLCCGGIAGIFFPLIFFIESALRDNYDSFLYPVSSLSIGKYGWVQVAAFIITGLLILFFAIGLKRRLKYLRSHKWIFRLMIVVSIGLLGAGIFNTDPVFGYPPDKPYLISQFTVHGHLHEIFSFPVFICIPITCFIMARQFSRSRKAGWAAYCFLSGIFMLVSFILSGIGFRQMMGLGNYAGLIQRLSVIIGWAWLFFIAGHLLKSRIFIHAGNGSKSRSSSPA